MSSHPTRSPRRSTPWSPRRAEAPTLSRQPAGATGGLLHVASFKLALLDFVIGLGRKVAAFCALLTLGWTYFRILFLGHSLHQLYPDAPDPELRQTMWVALLLIMAQGWDIATDQLEVYWVRLRSHLPPPRRSSQVEQTRRPLPGVLAGPREAIEPLVVHLGRFMDLCVAVANKVGAFAVLVYLIMLGVQFWSGATIRQMYPNAADPAVSFLADLAVYVVVLGWWAMPFEEIERFWLRLRGQDEASAGR